jgi:hypothetical protein
MRFQCLLQFLAVKRMKYVRTGYDERRRDTAETKHFGESLLVGSDTLVLVRNSFLLKELYGFGACGAMIGSIQYDILHFHLPLAPTEVIRTGQSRLGY